MHTSLLESCITIHSIQTQISNPQAFKLPVSFQPTPNPMNSPFFKGRIS